MTIQPKTRSTLAASGLALLLAACGGGDDTVNNNVAGVTSVSAGTPKYSQDLIITVEGRNLDRPMTAGASFGACATLALSTTAPFASSATTAYYRCTQPGLGLQQVTFTRPSDNVPLGAVTFITPVPQVTLAISNGAGVTGNVLLTLEPVRARITVNNFLAYVNAGFYTDTVFHRLVPGFVVQGGGYAKTLVPNTTPLPALKGGLGAPIVLEDAGSLSNVKNTVAMARTGEPNSATSQFFFNLVDNLFLNANASTGTRGYAVFATITAGADVVTAMTTAPCAAWPDFFAGDSNACLPNPNLVVTSATQTR